MAIGLGVENFEDVGSGGEDAPTGEVNAGDFDGFAEGDLGFPVPGISLGEGCDDRAEDREAEHGGDYLKFSHYVFLFSV